MFLALLFHLLLGANDASNILIGWNRFLRGNANVDWPLPRTGGATWQDSSTGDAWLFGGRAVEPREEVFGDLWLFRSRQRTWQQFTPLPGRGRRGAALCGLTNKVIVVVGGLEEDGTLSDETAVFDLQNDTWRFLVCNPMVPDHVIGNSNDTFWSMNGTETHSHAANVSCPTARCDAITWCNEGSLWVVGGNNQGGRSLDDSWRMDLASGIWQRHKDGPLHSDVDTLLLLHWVGSEQSAPTVWLTKKYNFSEYELWMFQNDRWSQLDDSSDYESPWPPARREAATWTDSFGNLWLYGGVSLASGDGPMMSDIWMYKVSSKVWVEPELENGEESPGPRAGSVAWADRRHAFLYGGRSDCSQGGEEVHQTRGCIQDDLWLLNVSYNGRSLISPSNENGFLRVADGPSAATPRPGSMSIEQARSPWHEDHSDVFGSVIFFGLSLSFFALFGVVLFFRRCVSCPPREHALLKEPPPVRYTVIPDDTYTA